MTRNGEEREKKRKRELELKEKQKNKKTYGKWTGRELERQRGREKRGGRDDPGRPFAEKSSRTAAKKSAKKRRTGKKGGAHGFGPQNNSVPAHRQTCTARIHTSFGRPDDR